MVGELVARKSQRDTCAETDRVTFYGYLLTALEDGPLESALQPHEETKDGQAVFQEILLQYGGRSKWESAHDQTAKLVKNEWNSDNGHKTLTLHIASFRTLLVDLKRCCKHTGRSPPTVREQVLWMVNSIKTTDSLLIAHIAAINGDPNGMGMNFEKAATHLMLADPIEKSMVKSRKKRNHPTIFSALSGRGETGVDFRWHNRSEFNALTADQKDKLSAWRETAQGKAAMNKARAEFNAKRKAKKLKEGGESNNGGSDEKNNGANILGNKQVQKKFQKAVAKASKKIVAASIEAKKSQITAADSSLEAAIKRRSNASDMTPIISSTLVKEKDDDEAAAEKKFTQQQTKIKLLAVKTRINKMVKKDVIFRG